MEIAANQYFPIYITIIAITYAIITPRYLAYPWDRVLSTNREAFITSGWLLIFVILFIGLRPISGQFVDMINYRDYYCRLVHLDNPSFDTDTQNLIFDNWFNWLAVNRIDIRFFFLVMSVAYFTCMWWACRRWFPDDTLFAFLIFLSAFSTFSYGTNGLKAGVASSIFLLALSYRDKLWLSLLIALISWGIHHSMHVVLVAYLLVLLIKNPKWYLWGWMICIALSFFQMDFMKEFFYGLTDSQGKEYLIQSGDQEWGGKTGFRADFLIYSALPVAIGCWVIFFRGVKSKYYNILFNLYLTINSMWLLCMYVPFNNRIAYLSWFLMPLVSIYPFLKYKFKSSQYSVVTTIGWGYLVFTLFMHFLYTG